VHEEKKESSKRLYFIDIARSVAILLMLQGHFVDATLSDEYRSQAYVGFAIWSYIRQFTAAIFLTVTGIIFTYLLLNQTTASFFQNQRIRKGAKRVIALLFWGYILQPGAFHVLQCIAIGILVIMVFYGFSLWIKSIPLYIYFILASLGLFLSDLYFEVLEKNQFWPSTAPTFIQNIFHGPVSIFPITPYLGFVLFGALLGSLLHRVGKKIHSLIYILPTFLVGICLVLFSDPFFLWLHNIPELAYLKLYVMAWIPLKIGMVLLVLSLVIALEAYLWKSIKPNLFLKLGQNTLIIFITHIFILYGPWLNMSVTKYYNHRIDANYIVPATLLFVVFFVVLVYLIDRYKKSILQVAVPIQNFGNRFFGIKD